MEQSMLASKFDGRIRVPSNLDFVTNISPDGEAVTIIFTQNRHPMATTLVKSACNAVIAISLRQ